MPAKVTDFQQPDPNVQYVVRDPVIKPDGVGICCICDNGNSLCVPEQHSGSFVTSYTAHTFAYWYTL